jgi:hypothetical protein
MLLFSLGTVPLMFGLGAFVSILSGKTAKKVMTVGAVFVAVLGISMLSQGFSLAGISIPGLTVASGSEQESSVAGVDVQTVNSTLNTAYYPNITVYEGLPVRWVIDAPAGSINGCNNRMIIRDFGIEYSFAPGENVVEFTPTKAGTFRYTCWMGMKSGTITVIPRDSAAAIGDSGTPARTATGPRTSEDEVPSCCG